MDEHEKLFEDQLDEMLKQMEQDKSVPKKIERKKGKRWLAVLLAIVLLLSLTVPVVLIASPGVYFNYLLDQLGRYDPSNDATLPQDKVDDILGSNPDLRPVDPNEDLPGIDDLPKPPGSDTIEKEKSVVNILLVGQDSNDTAVRTRSDTMILVTLHTKSKQVTLTSFMRDAYVQIPGYSPNKLNHAFEFGGLKLLNETLKVNFGVEVDGNVLVDFDSFKQIIDLLGGVDIKLTKTEAIYLVNGCRHDVHEGWNRLDGAAALDYARLREIDSDYQRTNRQRTVMLSIFDRYKSLPVDQMLDLLDEILPLIVTDMEKGQIVEYVLKCAPMLAVADYGTQQIPANGTFKQGFVQVREGLKNWFQYNIDFSENRKILQDIINGNR